MRENGTILYCAMIPDAQSEYFYHRRKNAKEWRSLSPVQGLLRADDGRIYAWREGHAYRDGTTFDRLQADCRVSFEVFKDDEAFADGLSYHLVEDVVTK